MITGAQWQYTWSPQGVSVQLFQQKKPVPMGAWKQLMPATASVLRHLPHQPDSDAIHLTHEQLAAMADHDAVMLGLPRLMEAWMAVVIEGRIDSPHFRVTHTLEPLEHSHAWAVYARDGALLTVGERQVRLNPRQVALFDALETMERAGSDVPARLRAWPALSAALHGPTQSLIRVQGSLPRLYIQSVAEFPPSAKIRVDGKLRAAGNSPWAMGPKHRYYLRAS